MKRQDKEIRMRLSGAMVLVIILISIIVFGNTNEPVKVLGEDRIAFQETIMLKRWAKEKEISEQRIQVLLSKAATEKKLNLQRENIRKLGEEAKRREEQKREEERIRQEREARVYNMIWSGEKGEYQLYAWSLFPNYGWSEYDLECLIELWRRESQWSPSAHNSSSGAHGIPQSLPASKMASHGDDYWDNPYTQIRWGLDYIAGRYGSPSSALGHSNSCGWY